MKDLDIKLTIEELTKEDEILFEPSNIFINDAKFYILNDYLIGVKLTLELEEKQKHLQPSLPLITADWQLKLYTYRKDLSLRNSCIGNHLIFMIDVYDTDMVENYTLNGALEISLHVGYLSEYKVKNLTGVDLM